MNNLKILIKNNLNCFLGAFQGKKNRKKTSIAVMLIVLCAIGIIALYTSSAYSTFVGLPAIVGLYNGCAVVLLVLVILAVMRTTGKIRTNDTELLLSLPLKKSEIIISKTLNKYAFDLFFAFALLAPYVVLYLIFSGFSVATMLLSILIIFLLPLMSVGITYIFNFIVVSVFNRSKHANFYKSITSIVIFVGLFILMLTKSLNYALLDASSYEIFLTNISNRPFSCMLIKILVGTDFVAILEFLALAILPFIIGIILYSIFFGKTFSPFHSGAKKATYKNSRNEFSSMLNKEFSTYFSTTAWIVNTIIGPLFMLCIAVAVCVLGVDKLGSFLGVENMSQIINAEGVKTYLSFVICLILCGLTSMTTISCCSISLEGKCFWIIKSSPINEKSLLGAKAMLNILLVIPVLLLSTIMVSIVLGVSFLDFLVMFSLPMLISIVISCFGLFINLNYPKFDWQDETQVIKQSLSTLLTMLSGLVITLVPVAIMLIFPSLAINVLIIITLALYLIAAITSITLLFTKGVKLYRKI